MQAHKQAKAKEKETVRLKRRSERRTSRKKKRGFLLASFLFLSFLFVSFRYVSFPSFVLPFLACFAYRQVRFPAAVGLHWAALAAAAARGSDRVAAAAQVDAGGARAALLFLR